MYGWHRHAGGASGGKGHVLTAPGSQVGGKSTPLGQILLERGQLTERQLDQAVAMQAHRGERLGELLCELGHLDQQTVRQALVDQAGIPQADFERRQPSSAALEAVSAELAFKHKVLPFATQNGTLCLAMADPFDRGAIETVRVLSGQRIERFFCPEADLLEATRLAYGSNVARMIADLDLPGDRPDISTADEQQLASRLQELAREPTVVNLVNLIILEAIEGRVSDIHVEPFEEVVKVKYRIDGILHEMSPPPKRLQPAIISRIKIMAGMNIAERFVPQDGHITIDSSHGKVDLRVATVPTVFGECVVMRILDRSEAVISLEHLGLARQCLDHFCRLLTVPHGIVLVTGPTGSGKTTTLYAALNRIYTPEKKIITIEDPVEYQLDGINQIPVNVRRGIGFANGLRAILRQDPDIIMVGEIRDQEAADIAIRSAMTGHLVFSTLHTNDAPGAMTRLLDMSIEPFLLASSLQGVLAQRLVRTICQECREPHGPSPEILKRIGHRGNNGQGGEFYRGAGCSRCRQTGYFGRVGVFELLRVTEPVRQVIVQRGTTGQIVAVAPPEHEPMVEDGFHKAAAGLTTLEEVLRVTQDTRNGETSD